MRREFLGQRQKPRIEKQHPVGGVIDDIADLLLEQPRVDGVADRADPGNAVVELEVPISVPGERRDAIADAHAELLECLAELFRAGFEITIGVAVQPVLGRAGDDLGRPTILGGVADQRRDQQRPVHYQPAHGFLRTASLRALDRESTAR